MTDEFLLPKFLAAMNDIGRYGHEKYGADSFHHRREIGDAGRGTLARCDAREIARHSAEHFRMYLAGEMHDHFGTLEHQLAAVAFNAMMEFFFAGFESEAGDVEDDAGGAVDDGGGRAANDQV